MKIIIEENDVFLIHILTEEHSEVELSTLKPKIILYCVRYRPFVREEVWNIYEDSIVGDFITEFKAMKEKEE